MDLALQLNDLQLVDRGGLCERRDAFVSVREFLEAELVHVSCGLHGLLHGLLQLILHLRVIVS
jgi:hypothetical protein